MQSNRFAFGSRILLAASLALVVGACAWVKLTPGGESVRVVTAAHVASCKKLGATHAKTSTRVGIFTRSPRKIDEELEYLARNEAALMGADAIAPQGPTSSEGRRSFDVFRCTGSVSD